MRPTVQAMAVLAALSLALPMTGGAAAGTVLPAAVHSAGGDGGGEAPRLPRAATPTELRILAGTMTYATEAYESCRTPAGECYDPTRYGEVDKRLTNNTKFTVASAGLPRTLDGDPQGLGAPLRIQQWTHSSEETWKQTAGTCRNRVSTMTRGNLRLDPMDPSVFSAAIVVDIDTSSPVGFSASLYPAQDAEPRFGWQTPIGLAISDSNHYPTVTVSGSVSEPIPQCGGSNVSSDALLTPDLSLNPYPSSLFTDHLRETFADPVSYVPLCDVTHGCFTRVTGRSGFRFTGHTGGNTLTGGVTIDWTLDLGSGGDGTDRDADSIPDGLDNCPDTPNLGQANSDGDGVGDACESDAFPRDDFVQVKVTPEVPTASGTLEALPVDPLGNDVGSGLSVANVTTASPSGTVTSNAAGGVAFTPPEGFVGPGEFTFRYEMKDGRGDRDWATVTVRYVTCSNVHPVKVTGSGQSGNDTWRGEALTGRLDTCFDGTQSVVELSDVDKRGDAADVLLGGLVSLQVAKRTKGALSLRYSEGWTVKGTTVTYWKCQKWKLGVSLNAGKALAKILRQPKLAKRLEKLIGIPGTQKVISWLTGAKTPSYTSCADNYQVSAVSLPKFVTVDFQAQVLANPKKHNVFPPIVTIDGHAFRGTVGPKMTAARLTCDPIPLADTGNTLVGTCKVTGRYPV